MKDKQSQRLRRHKRVRKKVSGTPQRPRLTVFRSLNQIYAQIIDDASGTTMTSASTLDGELREGKGHKGNVASAKKVGKLIASRAKEKGITKVVFDKGGYRYFGRIKALADTAREEGLKF